MDHAADRGARVDRARGVCSLVDQLARRIMAVWEYRIVRAETAEAFEAALNAAGAEAWEAISGGYAIGESKKVALGHGMPVSTQAGAATWSALMKRPRQA
jgi:hypothetical protein